MEQMKAATDILEWYLEDNPRPAAHNAWKFVLDKGTLL